MTIQCKSEPNSPTTLPSCSTRVDDCTGLRDMLRNDYSGRLLDLLNIEAD